MDFYLSGYDVSIRKEMGAAGTFTAINGMKHEDFIGFRRIIVVKFYDMRTCDLNELMNAIMGSLTATIEYVDPECGKSTRTFVINEIPTQTYFESDDGVVIWHVPDMTFEEETPEIPEGYG